MIGPKVKLTENERTNKRSWKRRGGERQIEKAKILTTISTVTCIILLVSLIAVYLNFSAIIQQQSDLIKEQADEIQAYRQAIDNLTSGINELWHNADVSGISANTTAQTAYFQPPD